MNGYATGGHLLLLEDALEAAVQEGYAQPNMVQAMVRCCVRLGDVPRTQRWLQRWVSLGLIPTMTTWHMAIDLAHEAGDADAADALWRDAEAAGAIVLYKRCVS
ncbi:hypothetical protein JKP88DRAFT_282040 [Tribonema minus]|uniref:Uncharacterized protein n=1 Tax=Tribonema minus TaxID=303371 RepID=A0A835YPA9_9STRA|nr:hypothetical protein JKP88DRAFT_282040 [Tribonema minus]